MTEQEVFSVKQACRRAYLNIQLFKCPDLLPTGQTGFQLSEKERNYVRAYYRKLRKTYSRSGSKRFATLLTRDYDRSEYSESYNG